jgi:hypothetical protein
VTRAGTAAHSVRCDVAISGECYCPGDGEQALPCGHLPEVGCDCADYVDEYADMGGPA